jgi:hypothetical protein
MGLFEIGKQFEEGKFGYSEGVKFDILGDECNLLIYAGDPSEKARQAITKGDFKYGYFKEDNVIIMLFKFGLNSWMTAPYSVHKSKNITELKELTGAKGFLLNIYVINSKSGVLEDIRIVELDARLSKMLIDDIIEQKDFVDDGFDSKVEGFYSKYSVKALVSMSRALV